MIKVIRNSINSALGSLAPYKATGNDPADVDAMYNALVSYWSAVRDVFPDAWGRPPTESRLMHSAGIVAMSVLMDRVMSRAVQGSLGSCYRGPHSHRSPLSLDQRQWPDLHREWNDIQNVGRDIKLLSDQLHASITFTHSRR